MTKSPKISVIIPVYNVEKYLRECLDSVINQTLEDIEIICVNDGSTDKSGEILNEYAYKDSRIKIIDLKKNVGLGKARNIAFNEVSAPYVMYLDSDDWYEHDACELAYNQIIKNDNDFVLYRAYTYTDDTKTKKLRIERFNEIEKYENEPHIKYHDLNPLYLYSIAPWFKIHKTSFIKEHNLFFEEGICYEDQPFWYKLILCNPDFSIINKPLIYYRQRKNSITKNPKFFIDLILVKSKVLKLYKEYGKPLFIKYFSIDCLKTISGFMKLSKENLCLYIKYYNKYREFLQMINKEIQISEFTNKIEYDEIQKILKHNLIQKLLLDLLQTISKIIISETQTHKIISILGIRMKFRRSGNKCQKLA